MTLIRFFDNRNTGIFANGTWRIVFLALLWWCWAGCSSEENVTNPELTIEPGTYEFSMEVDTTTRWFTVVIPTGYDHVEKRPLVVALHPGNANMKEFYNALKGFRDMAEAENWLMVFPNGRNRTDNRTGDSAWNAVHCCGLPHSQNVDDVGFIRKVLEKLQADYKIDGNRIYAMGRSNGGMLVHRLGVELWDTFAAIAPFSATAGGQEDATAPEIVAEPRHPLPILLMHGLHDPNVKYRGGLTSGGIRYDISFAESVGIWLEVNACTQAVADTTLFESDKGQTWIVDYSNCLDGAQVVAITVENSGHQLPRVSNSGFDGSNAIFQFFKSHAKN